MPIQWTGENIFRTERSSLLLPWQCCSKNSVTNSCHDSWCLSSLILNKNTIIIHTIEKYLKSENVFSYCHYKVPETERLISAFHTLGRIHDLEKTVDHCCCWTCSHRERDYFFKIHFRLRPSGTKKPPSTAKFLPLKVLTCCFLLYIYFSPNTTTYFWDDLSLRTKLVLMYFVPLIHH